MIHNVIDDRKNNTDYRSRYNLATLDTGYYSEVDIIPWFGVFSENVTRIENDLIFNLQVVSLNAPKLRRVDQDITIASYLMTSVYGKPYKLSKEITISLLKGCLVSYNTTDYNIEFCMCIKKSSLHKVTNMKSIKSDDLSLLVNYDFNMKTYGKIAENYFRKVKSAEIDIVYKSNLTEKLFKKKPVKEILTLSIDEEQELNKKFTDFISSKRKKLDLDGYE